MISEDKLFGLIAEVLSEIERTPNPNAVSNEQRLNDLKQEIRDGLELRSSNNGAPHYYKALKAAFAVPLQFEVLSMLSRFAPGKVFEYTLLDGSKLYSEAGDVLTFECPNMLRPNVSKAPVHATDLYPSTWWGIVWDFLRYAAGIQP